MKQIIALLLVVTGAAVWLSTHGVPKLKEVPAYLLSGLGLVLVGVLFAFLSEPDFLEVVTLQRWRYSIAISLLAGLALIILGVIGIVHGLFLKSQALNRDVRRR